MEDIVKIPLKTALAIALLLPACKSNNPSTTRAASEEQRTTTTSTDQMKRDRDDYVTTMKAKLAEFDQKVDGLKDRASAMKGPEKSNFDDAINRLRDQRKAVATKLDDVKSVSVESWQTLKGETDSAMADLERSYDQVSRTFEKTPAHKSSY
jgi:hypothetical protein